ncbi:MAG: hypothetical protein ACLQU1_10320, partial [Bryobacteraceae bacterium]
GGPDGTERDRQICRGFRVSRHFSGFTPALKTKYLTGGLTVETGALISQGLPSRERERADAFPKTVKHPKERKATH